MQSTENNSICIAVNEILKSANVSFAAVYIAKNKRDDWEYDEWRLYLETAKKYEFEFRTGLGLRHKPTAQDKLRAQMSLPGLTQKDIERPTIYGRRYRAALEELRKPKAPEAADLIYNLLFDAEACEVSFSEWCDSCGYSNDLIACQENNDKLKRIFKPEQIQQLRKALEDY